LGEQNVPFDTEALKEWFVKEARDLPWRRHPTPYAVWISEVMLQQTQVAVVREYYLRWMERFPSVEALAAASLPEVIKMWEGLGYYSRARNLHAAAQFLVEHHHGELPSDREVLLEIKGLGPYTIGAILSFAFHKRAAAVDGNVIRVLTRYFGIDEDVHRSATLKKIWEIAEGVLPESEPWLVVEGLIELGASVCKKQPQCWSCPLSRGCFAFQEGAQEELPKKGKKGGTTILHRSVYVIVCEGSLLLRKGARGKVMADLYEFPYLEQRECQGDALNSSQAGPKCSGCLAPAEPIFELRAVCEFPFPFAAKKVKNLPEVEHGFTRYRAKLYPAVWRAFEREAVAGHEWICMSQVHEYPFSAGHKKILTYLEESDAHTAY
jgi:A/G-specific adenine glycosylase